MPNYSNKKSNFISWFGIKVIVSIFSELPERVGVGDW